MNDTYGDIGVSIYDGRFSLLRPCLVKKSLANIRIAENLTEVLDWLTSRRMLDAKDAVAFDTETNGTTIFGNPKFRIVGISFAHQYDTIYLSTKGRSFEQIKGGLTKIRDTIEKHQIPVIAFNLFFDASVLAYYLGSVRPRRKTFSGLAPETRRNFREFSEVSLTRTPADGWITQYRYCAYGLFRYLASEGFPEQKWSLKFAQKNLLLWKNTNEGELDSWLVNNGYVTLRARKILKTDSQEEREQKLKFIAEGLVAGKNYRPDKSKMFKAPDEILGKYCCLDSYSTYWLYRAVLLPAMQTYTVSYFRWFHQEVFLTLVRNCIDNYQKGIFIDELRLRKYREKLTGNLSSLRRRLYLQFRDIIDKVNQSRRLEAPEKRCKIVPDPGPEPEKKYAKSGKILTSWKQWHKKKQRFDRTEGIGELTAQYGKHLLKKHKLKKVRELHILPHDYPKKDPLRKFIFNLNSTANKQTLLYDGVEYEVASEYRDERRPGSIRLKKNDIELDLTKSQALPTGKAATMAILGPDNLLDAYNKEIKKLQFTDAVLKRLTVESRIHLPMKIPGTLTTRLGGDGGCNLQNQPKDREFLECWRSSDPKTRLICNLDWTGVEPHVLTEFSRDKTMMMLYGPDAKPGHDVYLFNAAMCGGAFGDAVVKAGYNVNSPIKADIEACKKANKKIRQIYKAVTLSDDYGSSAEKKFKTLRISGVDITLNEMLEIQERMNNAYAGKKTFGEKLKRELKINGFILDGLGFPIGIDPEKSKDSVNRCLAEGTLVRVENRGWQRIESIDTDCRVWDGVSWVQHAGVSYNGEREVISMGGIRCTKDHLIMTTKGDWEHAERIRAIQERAGTAQQAHSFKPVTPNYSWKDVWELGCSIIRTILGK